MNGRWKSIDTPAEEEHAALAQEPQEVPEPAEPPSPPPPPGLPGDPDGGPRE